ncbi:pyridoxamine 5'-phosphate oxidase family protein [Promicromonospora kroppenstedtii]|uniref:pyridoxamine 5'-phosphate oxidase family protein n=1 Tax=Promicromonospora kroppenstedtii TaxID=440482 RepID=UPI0004AC9C4D|nr:pyridoxamine 5'-phosphate oxidase family protein [Promicromonospora kroppenstedtii]
MKTKNLATLYDLPTLDWAPVAASLDRLTQAPGTGGPDRHSHWLTTVNADGSPHVTGIGAIWFDGAYWVVSGRSALKARNLERDPRCAVAVATADYDTVVDGTARLVTDREEVAEVSRRLNEGGWPCEPDASGSALTAPYSAPSAGPAPWHVYRVTPTRATALYVRGEGGATSFEFD